MTTPIPAALPILLIPGLGGSLRSFAPVLPALWRFGPVTIVNHTGDDSIGAIARRVLADAPPRFALAGHSMGGYIAFEILRQAPERVAKLALINTQARADTPEAVARRQALAASGAASSAPYAVLDRLWPYLVHPSRRDDPGLKQLMRDMSDDIGAVAYARQQAAVIGRPDSRPLLPAITCPTLVMSGDEDNVVPNSLSVEMADAIRDSKLVILSNCGHMSMNEQPVAATAALTGWLSS